MPLLTAKFGGDYFQVTGASSTVYDRVEIAWSGLPKDVTIQRCYWQFDVDRQNGGVYARWYEYGNAGNAGSTGISGAGFTFEVGKVTGTSGTARVYLGSQNGWTKYTNITFNIEYAYKQSSLSLSAETVEAGKAIKATISAQSSTATHTLVWKLGSNSTTHTLAAGTKSKSFTVPLSWLPSATSGTATCTLTTLEGGVAVGESQTVSFKVTVNADVKPSCTVKAGLVNGFEGLYLGGRSSVKLTIENATAGEGASIASYKFSGSGYSKSANTATFGPLNAGEHTFTATVKDSRGRSGTAKVTVQVEAYAPPTLSKISIYRSNQSGTASETGGYIALKATVAYTALGGKNALTFRSRYRPVGGSWSAWTAMTSGTRLMLGGALSTTASYEAEIQATDTVGNVASYAAIIPTASVTFNLKEGGKGAAFGKYAEADNVLELAKSWGLRRDGRSLTPAPRNLLDNSNFAVNQRRATEYAYGSTKYTIDRWVTYCGVKVDSRGYITVSNDHASSSYNFYQDFPLGTFDGSKTYTGAMKLATGELYVGSGVPVEGGTTDLFKGDTFDISIRKNYGDTAKDRFYVQLKAGVSLNILWIAFYEGAYTADSLPEYVPKGYAAELLECQRYYYQASNYTCFAGYKSTATYFFIPLPTQMRVTPSVTATNIYVRGSVDGEGTTQSAAVSAVDDRSWGNMVRITLTGDTKTSNQPIVAVTYGLELSADV